MKAGEMETKPSVQADGTVRFGGRIFGAFPPLEQRRKRQEKPASDEFANKPPLPVPPPVAERRVPAPAPYSSPYGYGTGYGSWPVFPGWGAGVYGPYDPYGYGSSGVATLDPGQLGLAPPGFAW